MGVLTVSSSTSQTPIGLNASFPTNRSSLKRTLILAFKNDKTNKKSSRTTHESVIRLSTDSSNEQKRIKRANESAKRVKALSTDVAYSPCTSELDYSEAAAKLENIYKLTSPIDISDIEENYNHIVRRQRRTKIVNKHGERARKESTREKVVRNQKKVERLSLDKRIALARKEKEKEVITLSHKKEDFKVKGGNDVERLLREYSVSTDLASFDWKKMKMPSVLPSSEHTWLFELMQPMKAVLKVKENLRKDLKREPTDGELAAATNTSINEVRRQVEVGKAARNKLIKHNLRLVLFVINKYFQEFASGPRYQDLCQAGAKGLITAIDRFEPKLKLRLSTYGLFWIRHTIIRSLTLSSFTRVSFGVESVRVEIQRAKLELMFELEREPTEEEIIEKVGISPERYHEVMKATKPVFSLHSKHSTTQEEFINGITDNIGVGGDKCQQPALLRLALDDVLDSLKPKESLVIRQRYGLDGKGERTLGEIAGNLNISREMVRKHEVKALMKLKHPARVDYLCRYIF